MTVAVVLLVVLGVTAAVWLWLRRPRRRVRHNLAAAVTTVTGADPQLMTLVKRCKWDGDRDNPKTAGLSSGRLFYPEGWRDTPENQRALLDQVSRNLGGIPVNGDFDTANNYVDFTVGLDLPDFVWCQLHRSLPWHLIPIGIADGGDLEAWNLLRDPHSLIISKTGSGKTNIQRMIAAHCLATIHPWRIIAINPKRVALRFLRGMPNSEVHSEPWAMSNAIAEARQRMRSWYAAEEAGLEPEPLWELLIIDELAELSDVVDEAKELAADLRSASSLSRECHQHLCIATQSPDIGKVFKGSTREQLAYRVACGPLDDQRSRMFCGDSHTGQATPVGRASGHPGRVLVNDSDGIREVQAFYIPDPVRLNPDIPRDKAEAERKTGRRFFPLPKQPRALPAGAPPEPDTEVEIIGIEREREPEPLKLKLQDSGSKGRRYVKPGPGRPKSKRTCDECGGKHYARGKCQKHYQRLYRAKGASNGRKDPDDIGYMGAHKRLYQARGKAKVHRCIDCGQQAESWSLNWHEIGESQIRWSHHNGYPKPFSPYPESYSARCRACHDSLDRRDALKPPTEAR